jgi:hypothetical protein
MSDRYKYFPKVSGWTRASKKKPLTFDLIQMRMPDETIKIGWWNGHTWENRNHNFEEIIEWKRHDARCVNR